jgi:hypothetical protein
MTALLAAADDFEITVEEPEPSVMDLLSAVVERLSVPRIATLYEAPISEGEAERMQRLVAFGAAMDVLRRRTSWRSGRQGVRS